MTPPADPEAVETLANTLRENEYDMRATLRVLFNSDFFKNARFARLKNPTEVVVGTLRMVGGAEFPAPGIGDLSRQPSYMGQDLLNPPSVEGWHTGAEWINSGSLMRRVNFTAELVGDVSRPGIRDMVDRLEARGVSSAAEVVDGCLDLMGPLEVTNESRDESSSASSARAATSPGAPGMKWPSPLAGFPSCCSLSSPCASTSTPNRVRNRGAWMDSTLSDNATCSTSKP